MKMNTVITGEQLLEKYIEQVDFLSKIKETIANDEHSYSVCKELIADLRKEFINRFHSHIYNYFRPYSGDYTNIYDVLISKDGLKAIRAFNFGKWYYIVYITMDSEVVLDTELPADNATKYRYPEIAALQYIFEKNPELKSMLYDDFLIASLYNDQRN